MAALNIPPVFVDAEPAPPALAAFQRKLPAEALVVGDAIVLHGQAWRVKSCRPSRQSREIVFVLYPCAGGRPHSVALFLRQWLPVLCAIKEV